MKIVVNPVKATEELNESILPPCGNLQSAFGESPKLLCGGAKRFG